ncbi:hypothetical protein [Achromobacter phage Motura]|uniref:Uncharacterized protein n=1 Tax=Achromobacter phage Motura TaxID=2591403 RepID=A0A514CSR1_9CAUD|nr:hypothetical protein H1O15_gp306 [Achromobacter phage Motura]QDH83500.1 hypothetical protein [Achromobacter phage Motura]
MSKTTLEILKEARQLLEKPESWIKGYYAAKRESDGRIQVLISEEIDGGKGVVVRAVGGTDPRADCFCMLGALQRAGALERNSEAEAVLRDAIKIKIGFHDQVHSFNDSPQRTHDEVLAVFDIAIQQEQLK